MGHNLEYVQTSGHACACSVLLCLCRRDALLVDKGVVGAAHLKFLLDLELFLYYKVTCMPIESVANIQDAPHLICLLMQVMNNK